MQTEKLPTNRPGEPSPPDGSLPEIPDKNSPAEQIRQSDRLFRLCFLPAVVLVVLFCVWLGFQDIYGTARTSAEQHRIKIQVYRPPIKHPKPKPKPKPKIIPPKPKVIPKIVHVIPKPQPIPRPQPRPRPVVTRAPSVGHVVHTNTPAPPIGPVTEAPPVAVPQNPGTATTPTAPVQAPPPPPVQAPPPPPPPVQHEAPPPPPPPPPPPKPKPPAIPDREEPALIGSFSDISLPQFDPTALNSTSVDVTWEVDAQGHVHNVKFKPTGSSDVDDAIRSAVQNFKFKPRVINGVPQPARVSHTFELGG